MLLRQLSIIVVLLLMIAGCLRTTQKTVLEQPAKREILRCDLNQIDDDEAVTFFPSYAYLKGNQWIFKIEGWVRAPKNNRISQFFYKSAFRILTISGIQNESKFWSRFKGIAADSKNQIEMTICLGNKKYILSKSTNGGRISDVLRLPLSEVAEFTINSENWIPFYATTKTDRSFKGKVRLISPKGVSVISDIDDTIKVSEVYAGSRVLLRNIFDKTPKPTEGMVTFYASLQAKHNAEFHYLSASPWPIFELIEEFRADSGYPEGAYELKEFCWEIGSKFCGFLASDSTLTHKKSYIQELLENFPKRQFILIGDSGEKDPEIYAWALNRYRDQIRAVYIRHVPSKDKGELTKDDILQLFRPHQAKVKFINRESGAIE